MEFCSNKSFLKSDLIHFNDYNQTYRSLKLNLTSDEVMRETHKIKVASEKGPKISEKRVRTSPVPLNNLIELHIEFMAVYRILLEIGMYVYMIKF